MSASLTGDLGKLPAIARGFEQAKPAVDAARKKLGTTLLDVYHEGFARRQGPLGNAWGTSLYKTGNLANPTVRVTDNAVRIVIVPKYGYPLFFGWGVKPAKEWRVYFVRGVMKSKRVKPKEHKSRAPARPMIPSGAGIGWWESPLKKTVTTEVERYTRSIPA